MNTDNIKEQFDRLSDELIDDIINTPDSEILQEVKEDYGKSDYLANKFRNILEKSKIEVGKQKLQLAKEELRKKNNQNQIVIQDDTNAKERLLKYIKENPGKFDEITLAARNGNDISEEDAKGILEDLKELEQQENNSSNKDREDK